MFRQRLDELVNLQHPLARLAQHIDWQVFEQKWAPDFPSSRSRPATPTRLIAGLLYLQHIFALSDADVVWGWVENPYWQLFQLRYQVCHSDNKRTSLTKIKARIWPNSCLDISQGSGSSVRMTDLALALTCAE